MNVQDLFRTRLGEWAFGSALGWGCLAPFGGLSDVLGGACANYPCCCTVAQLQACTGASCSGGSYCNCPNDPDGPGDCVPVSGSGVPSCPAGCDPVVSMKCHGGDMSPCYYPPP